VHVEGNALGTDYGFCIDRAEVSHQSYRAFWRAVDEGNFDPAPVLAERPECSFKASGAGAFVPAFGDLLEADWDNTAHPLLPIVSVDWCDAYAYCAYAGKRLCGGVNGSTIAYKQEQPRNEWYLACSNGDQRSFCYADDGDNVPAGCVSGAGNEASCPAYDPNACASEGDCNGWRGLWEESEASTCGAANPALVNLSGNVAEWVDACEEVAATPGTYRCEARGGSCPLGTYTSCHWRGDDGPRLVETRANYTGFRCCWDGE
jgi:formylglycine-generating enzyme required for sulfatase activity